MVSVLREGVFAQISIHIHIRTCICAFLRGGCLLREFEWAAQCTQECVVVKVYKGQLYIKKALKGYETRLEATIMLLQKAVEQFGASMPNFDAVLDLGDHPKPFPFWAYTAWRPSPEPSFLIPDYSLTSWREVMLPQSYQRLKRHIFEAGVAIPFEKKAPTIMFRGAATHNIRQVHNWQEWCWGY